MTTTLEDEDGVVTIEDLRNGRLSLTFIPGPGRSFLPGACETSYPVELIQSIMALKGSAALCQTITREEDPDYVERLLRNDLFAYFDKAEFAGKQILDFGCGCGASSIILARLFPQTDISGVDLDPMSLAVARKMAVHYDLPNLKFYRSPSGAELPPEVGQYDFVVMSAVFEHLLPHERKAIMPKLWSAVREGGYLFINQTPNSLFPFELHTTMLPFINYLPDSLTHRIARKFSKQIDPDDSWEELLRQGIRGATEKEIMRLLPRDTAVPVMLEPKNNGLKDRIDLYYLNTNFSRLKMVKRIARVGIKAVRSLTGLTVIPDLSLVFHKPHYRRNS